MALSDIYATVNELKSYLGISDAIDDDEAEQALNTVSRAVEKWCSRQFNDAGSASARVYYPENSGMVHVDDFHTTTGLVVATDGGDDGTYETTWASTDYQLEPLNGVMDGISGWPYNRIRGINRWFPCYGKRPSVQVTARWGWAAVPAGIKQATLILAAEALKLREAPFGVAGFGDFGPVRIRENPIAARYLHPYKLHAVRVG